jgi:hypothetical protein
LAEEKLTPSIHRAACKVIGLSKSGFYYKHKKPDDGALIDALNKKVDEHPQEGFWFDGTPIIRTGLVSY